MHGALVVFDLTRRESFEELPKLLPYIKGASFPPGAPILLVGHNLGQCLLDPKQRQVTREEANLFALNQSLLYIEACGREYINVQQTFTTVIEGTQN